MRTLAYLELFCAIFVMASLISQFVNRSRLGIRRRMIMLSFLTFLWLLSDALPILLNGPQNPQWFIYTVNLLGYVMSNLVLGGFMLYCDACLSERTRLKKWIFRIPMIILLICAAVDVVAYMRGTIVQFIDGYMYVIGAPPLPVLISYVLMLFVPPAIAFHKLKDVGIRTALLLTGFGIPTILAIILILVTGNDYSVILGSVTILVVSRTMQNDLEAGKLEESLTFTDYFLGTYVSAYYVDLNRHTCKIYKRSEQLERKYPIFLNYFRSLDEYINHEVHPDDREELLEMVKPETMKKRLKEQKEFAHLFRDISGGTTKTYRLQVIRGADENHAAFGFIDITEEIREESLRQAEAEGTRKIIESVASSYNVAYVVNMADDTFKLLRMGNNLKENEGIVTTFSQAKELFLSKIVHPNDREFIDREMEYDRIRENLKDRPSYSVEYRVLSKSGFSWHEMLITQIDKDEVAMGFAQRDMEITKEHLGEKIFEEYLALFVVDIDTELVKAIYNSSWCSIVKEGDTAAYSDVILEFSKELDEDPKAFFVQLSDINYAKHELAKEDKRTYLYKSNFGDGEKWIDVTSYVIMRHEDGTPAMFTIGFSYADTLSTTRQELQKTISEQNALLEAQYSLLEEARNSAEAASNSKTSFLFNMSHDIRTPMNAITGFTAMAKKYIEDKDKVMDYLDKIDISGQQLLVLINQVLEMARIESGKLEFNASPVNIPEEFNAMVTVFSAQAKSMGLDFGFSLEDVIHRNVLADKARMGSITLNIVGNAMKYTPSGGRVSISLKEVSCPKEGFGTYIFTVSDTGIGMSEEYIKQLFEPFTREKTSTVSKIQGTGLGMSIVKSLVDLMGGSISVNSKPGEGTRFDIKVDLKLCEDEDKDIALVKEEAVVSFDGLRVLVVEDNEMNREIAKDILEESGFVVEEAADGDIAVDLVRKAVEAGTPNYYDLILMDVQMPRMNGYDATRAIRALPGLGDKHIPIIAMTANAFEEDRKNALEAGMDEHLPKPIVIQKLISTLAGFLLK